MMQTLMVQVVNTVGLAQAGLRVYAFNNVSYPGYNKPMSVDRVKDLG